MSKVDQKTVFLPLLRFSNFDNSSIWKAVTIDSLIEDGVLLPPKDGNHGNIHPKSSDYVESGIPFIMASDLQSGQINLKECNYISKNQADSLKKGFALQGDVLLTHKGTVGEVAIVGDEEYPYIMLTPQVTYYRVKDKNRLSNTYLAAFFNSDGFQEDLLNLSGGGTRNYIGITQQKKLHIVLPDNIKEQQKIAACLSSLDDLITAETDKLTALEQHKKGMLQKLFPAEGETVPELRFGEFEGEWEESTLGRVADYRRGSFPQPYGLPEWYDDQNGMPFIQVYDVGGNMRIKSQTKRKISELAAEQSVFIEKGTVIITLQGSIGRVAITQFDAYIDRTLLLFTKFHVPINKVFFAYLLQLLFHIEKQKAPGGIIKTITKQVLTNFEIVLPKIGEQKKIAEFLSSLDDLMTEQMARILELQAHKKGLLQQLFPKIH